MGYIDFCAPGVEILTTWRDSKYAYGSGTSFAAPFVAGVAALMLSKHPQLSAEDVIETLRLQAEDLGEAGWDKYYGWGLVNAYSAVAQTPIPEFSNPFFLTLALSTTTMAVLLLKKAHGDRSTRLS